MKSMSMSMSIWSFLTGIFFLFQFFYALYMNEICI